MICADREYLPFQELGLHLLRQARDCFAEAVQRMEGHSMAPAWQQVVDFCDKAAPRTRLMGTVGLLEHEGWSAEAAMASLPPGPAQQ